MTQQGGHQGECSRRKRRVSSLFSGEVEPTAGACALGVRSHRLGQHTVQEVGEAREEGVREARGEAEYTQADVGREAEAPLGRQPADAKEDGDAPVQAYIAAMPGWKRDVGRRLDALIVRSVPGARKAVRWNSPLYGIEGQGWFLGFHTFTNYVKVTFFRGTSLRPVPPGGTGKDARWIDIHEDDLDEARMAGWMRQAAARPGWGKS